jgi:Prolyl oligopeptidase family
MMTPIGKWSQQAPSRSFHVCTRRGCYTSRQGQQWSPPSSGETGVVGEGPAERAYPAILVNTSLNDIQVVHWEPARYVAKMRALTAGAPATGFKIDLDAGHGGTSGG